MPDAAAPPFPQHRYPAHRRGSWCFHDSHRARGGRRRRRL